MGDTLTVNDGYQHAGEDIVITEAITEAQFRRVEEILGRHPERFKEWSEMFFFTPADTTAGAKLCAYLREQRISHCVERREAFTSHERPSTEGGGE
jgi:hypothetical protein